MIKNEHILFNQYEQVREEFHLSLVNLSNDKTHPAFASAVDVVNSLYSDANKIFTPDGSLIVELENEKLLVLLCISNSRPNAFADRSKNPENQNIYLAGITTGLIRTLFEISAAIWGDSRFLPKVFDANSCMSPNVTFSGLDIPKGFESIYFEYMGSQEKHTYTTQPVWLTDVIENLSKERRELMISTFREALRLSWLHESAHILKGHVDFNRENQAKKNIQGFEFCEFEYLELGNSGSNNNPILDEVRCALEFDADNFALDYLFKEAYNANDYILPITTFLGSILCFMMLHCFNEVRKKRGVNLPLKHPPLWFRAFRVKEVESMWARYQQKRIMLSSARRERNLNILDYCLLDITNINPLFGHWLYPLVDNSFDDVQKKIMAEMIGNLGKIQKSLLEKSYRLSK